MCVLDLRYGTHECRDYDQHHGYECNHCKGRLDVDLHVTIDAMCVCVERVKRLNGHDNDHDDRKDRYSAQNGNHWCEGLAPSEPGMLRSDDTLGEEEIHKVEEHGTDIDEDLRRDSQPDVSRVERPCNPKT